jgi:FkbM family methyltransferase
MKLTKLFDNRFTRPLFNSVIKNVAWYRPTRRALNFIYNQLSYPQKEFFFSRFYLVLRSADPGRFKPDTWVARFGKVDVLIPLVLGHWSAALALLGHDSTVKETYENILNSDLRPDLFIDIGANTGLHSLLMAKAGVRTIAFEPNPECRPTAFDVFRVNDVAHIEWHQCALGSARQEVVLAYPPGESWLGSISSYSETPNADDRIQIVVEQRRLDDFSIDAKQLLIKIDVEGQELEVLSGGKALVSARRPLVIFESNERGRFARDKLFDYFSENGYLIHELPWWATAGAIPITWECFFASESQNFIAVPSEHFPQLKLGTRRGVNTQISGRL